MDVPGALLLYYDRCADGLSVVQRAPCAAIYGGQRLPTAGGDVGCRCLDDRAMAALAADRLDPSCGGAIIDAAGRLL